VLAADRGRAFLLVRPETGRTHQIRVHLAAVGAPVSGDTVYGRRAFVLLRPETGRTHQIRVHLAAVSAPVSGDTVYGRKDPTAPRQLLHAWQLDVPHPSGGRITITAPLPPDMVEAVRAIGPAEVALPYTIPTPATRYEDPAEA
ncbi:MAG TPA: hypothetical protein VFK32_07960, partial [Tepidiformaceae bacterium]|nr:hypothetical protein [Tepidiformaceae bacterium]